MTKTRFPWIVLLALLLAGCSSAPNPRNLIRDEQAEIELTIPCYFSSGGDKYVEMNENAIPLLLANPVWKVSDGVTLGSSSLSAERAVVTWSDFKILGMNMGMEVTVMGLDIHVNATVHIAGDSAFGKKQFQVSIPNISVANTALKAKFDCPKQNEFISSDTFSQPISVYATNGQRIWANIWPTLIVIGVIAAIIIGWAFLESQ